MRETDILDIQALHKRFGIPLPNEHEDWLKPKRVSSADTSLIPDEIALAKYDPSWPRLYEEELARVSAALTGSPIQRAEHIGSTAVPGMIAKPIVDILLGVNSLENARTSFPPVLEKLGYAF